MQTKLVALHENKTAAIAAWKAVEIDRLSKVDSPEIAKMIADAKEKTGAAQVVFVPNSQAQAMKVQSGWWTYEY